MGFKEQLLLNCLPRTDDIISIWTDPDVAGMECPGFDGTDSDYILIAGVEEKKLSEVMCDVKQRKEEFVKYYRGNFSNQAWEVRAKPIVLVEDFVDELAFLELMASLDEGDQAEVLSEIQLALNEPWGKVTNITPDVWRKIRAIWRRASKDTMEADEE